jgi:hypothetical protein
MRIIQFEIPGEGRRVGVIQDHRVRDVTSIRPGWQRVVDVFRDGVPSGHRIDDVLGEVLDDASIATLDYAELLAASPSANRPFLHPPLDDSQPHRVLITGTGLTHLGSMQSRDDMHSSTDQGDGPVTDSKRMFQMGLDGGRPAAGRRGVAPEWFYKGNGRNLRGHRWTLEIPPFASDGGEEAELVGCYVIDPEGTPRRLGFALGNEWSDHETERINYLYLAPSKLRQCAVGPELVTDFDFQELRLTCSVRRGGATLYESGELLSGERHMCHSLANCEDHHFKYPQHREPGDVHLHFFGTSKLSFGERDWKYETGDEIEIRAPDLGASLINTVQAIPADQTPVRVETG